MVLILVNTQLVTMVTMVNIRKFIVRDNAYVLAWHCSACNLQFEHGVDNRKSVSKIRTLLGLFFVTTRKKVDCSFYYETEGGFS